MKQRHEKNNQLCYIGEITIATAEHWLPWETIPRHLVESKGLAADYSGQYNCLEITGSQLPELVRLLRIQNYPEITSSKDREVTGEYSGFITLN